MEVRTQELREPGSGDVAITMKFSGVNPLDVKRRGGAQGALVPADGIVPHSDGAGTITRIGNDVRGLSVGQRVWVWGVGQEFGTAASVAVVPAARISPLPDDASFELGASLGIPAVTAALCLSRYRDRMIDPASRPFEGKNVLVRGAGAVAHFTIQLAKSMGACVAVSASEPRLSAAKRAGADFAVDRRSGSVHRELDEFCPEGYDVIVDVSPATNIQSDVDLSAPRATIALYGREAGNAGTTDFRVLQSKNITIRSIRTPDLPTSELGWGARTVTDAIDSIGVGDDHGLPIQIFDLQRIAEAHELVENSFHGKVLVRP